MNIIFHKILQLRLNYFHFHLQTVSCQMSSWSGWSSCSQTCGAGTQTRSRSITRYPSNGGSACGSTSGSQYCNTQSCPPSKETIQITPPGLPS